MTRILHTATLYAAVGASLLSACRSKDNVAMSSDTTNSAISAMGAADTSPHAHNGGKATSTQGTLGSKMDMTSMMSAGMMDSMQAHVHAMQNMSADQMQATLGVHRQMTANMLSQMNREMQQMNMPSDVKWTALMDSLRQDLVRMPEMTATQLHSFMPAHVTRMTHLMEMHQTMMRTPSSASR